MQNDVFYIQEAFKKLQLLNEDSFNLQDVGVVDELNSFVANDIEAPYEEQIIDIDADYTDELQDSYVGKVILQCKCCNAKIYKDAIDVFVNEEEDCANEEEECPFCGNAYGFAVIGKIEPYNEEEFKEDEVETEVETTLDLTDDEITEAIRESLVLKEDVQSIKDKVSEYLSTKLFDLNDNLAYVIASDVEGYKPEWCETDGWSSLTNAADYAENDYIEALVDILFAYAPKQESFNEDVDIHVDTTEDGVKVELEKEANDMVVVEDDSVEELVDEGCKKVNEEVEIHIDQDAEGNAIVNVETDNFEEVEVKEKEEVLSMENTNESVSNQNELNGDVYNALGDVAYKYEVHKEENLTKADMEKATKNFNDKFFAVEDDDDDLFEEYLIQHETSEDVAINPETSVEHDQKLEDPEEEPVMEERNEVSLNEDIENLSLDTETTHMEMTSDDNGKVVVVTEPREKVEEVIEDEMIVPLTDEEQDTIVANVEEEPVEDEFEVDEFEEESFDELGESFLRRVYENVNSFKTTKVNYSKGSLIVEGLIKFNSGKEKTTTFKFGDFRTSSRGKTTVKGLNEMFSKSKSAFILRGTLKNKKFISESIIYNYNASVLNEANENTTIKIYGRAVVRNK